MDGLDVPRVFRGVRSRTSGRGHVSRGNSSQVGRAASCVSPEGNGGWVLGVAVSMKKIGFIGAGHIGSTLARLAIDAGYEVLLSNRRGPASLSQLVAELGPAASAVTPSEAATADLVVVTVPLHAIDQLPEAELVGKTVIDTNNYYPDRDGRIPELDSGESTTSEMLQRRLPGSRIVKAFSNVVYLHLRQLPRPANDPQRSTLPMAGDDAEAKALVAGFADSVGFDVLDVGGLHEGWRFENGRPAYCLPYAADPEAMRGSEPGSRPMEAKPAARGVIAALIERG
ncbi:NADPH-dependent F420 reductase [Corynebacterium variabile]|uniref:NADPH-dependent F420 reductase n=1 Tax=Corynebacterium variabile TaxID=1727 RepID=UPI003FD49719